MIRKAFSTLSNRHPSFLRSIKGEVVPYPKNAVNIYGKQPIVAVGVEAILMADETYPSDVLRNMAKINYLNQREKLLGEFRGYWLVTSSNKSMMIVEHEAVAVAVGEEMFRSKTEDYFVGCIGSEVISQAVMGMSLAGKDQDQDQDQEDWTTAVYVDGEYSFNDGATFWPQRMKYATGACMMGIPKSVTSQYTLQRGPDAFYIGPDGRHTRANVYQDIVIRVAGVPITTPIIESRDWLLGHTVYKHFISSVDTESTPPVVMVPRAAK